MKEESLIHLIVDKRDECRWKWPFSYQSTIPLVRSFEKYLCNFVIFISRNLVNKFSAISSIICQVNTNVALFV